MSRFTAMLSLVAVVVLALAASVIYRSAMAPAQTASSPTIIPTLIPEGTALPDSAYRHAQATLGSTTLDTLVADTDALRELGLGGRDGLGPQQAMLFVFAHPAKEGFWMKDMRFPIDIVWIGADSRVVWIERSVSPDTYPKAFFPPSPAQYVIEIAAGQSDRLGISLGSTVAIKGAI